MKTNRLSKHLKPAGYCDKHQTELVDKKLIGKMCMVLYDGRMNAYA